MPRPRISLNGRVERLRFLIFYICRKGIDVFLRLVTALESRTPIAWIKYRPNAFSLFGNNLTLGFFVPRPVTDYLGLYVLCTSAKQQNLIFNNPDPKVKW